MRLLKLLIAIACLLAPTLGFSDELTPAKKVAIKDLMQTSGAVKLAEVFGNLSTQEIAQFWKDSRPDIDPKAFDILKEEVDTLVHEELKTNGSYYTYFYPVYHKFYTLEEIKGLIKFYRTPLGKKTVALMPKMSEESIKVSKEWAKSLFGSQFEQRLLNRLQEEGIKFNK
ncbi:DUF2059 domain-containing protein [Thermodesulfobacteriota bacterium]